MIKKVFGLCLLVGLITSCKKSSWLDGYTRDSDGFYYKLVALGDGNLHPQNKDVVVADAVMRTQADSVFWDTQHDGVNGFFMDLSSEELPGSCHSYFSKLVEGDSVSFLIRPSTFFRLYFDTVVPYFCQNDSLVKLDLKITEIISKAQYLALKENSEVKVIDDRELQELELINCYIMNDYGGIQPDLNGIYYLNKTETNSEPVSVGKRIRIAITSKFIDGRPLGKLNQEMEYTYGTPDQTVKGLNIVIGTLKKGETAKIIVPSRLAFGEKGSSNGSVPPYTPIVFDLKIIDIK